jgi:transposase
MSTSILYHGFGIVGYRYIRTRYEGGAVIFTIEQDPSTLACPVCENRKVVKKGKMPRRFMTVPIGEKTVFIELAVQRVRCLMCGVVRQVNIRFADAHKRFTRQFERYVLGLCQKMTMLDVAGHLKVSWDVVKDIQKRYLRRSFSQPSTQRSEADRDRRDHHRSKAIAT